KSSWKTQTKDLEDVYNQYSNQDSKKLKKLTIQDRVEGEKNQLSIDDGNNNPKFLEQEFQTKDTNKVVNSKVALSSKGDLKISGVMKLQVYGSDSSFSSCDDAQNELAKSKSKKFKAPGKDIDPDSDKTPKHNSLKLEKYLQKSLEITKEEEEQKKKKKKKKKNTEDKNLIDNDEHKTSTCKENGNSIKNNCKPSKIPSKQIENSSQESLEVLTEEEKKKKNCKDKDLIDNEERKTSTDKSKPSTFLKERDFGKLDKCLLEVLEVPKEKKKKKNFEDKDLIDNNERKTSIERENRNSIKDKKKPLKTSNKLKNILKMNESLQESLELPKKKRKKEHDAKDQDSGENEQISAEKNKKEKKDLKKKLQSSGSNVTNEVAIKNNVKDLAEDSDKSLVVSTPRQNEVKEEEMEANISSNTKQKSGEPTTAKAFQRVKVEEVQFVDPRLQDNSYWAKSGAEIGYGAKAEQVLGQVRG
ncbi:hypothetical protein KI387_023933, partial [Taxus chinensis]